MKHLTKTILIALIALNLSQITKAKAEHAHMPETIHDFKLQENAPINKWLIDLAINLAELDPESCNQEHFISGIQGNLRAVYSNDDTCDGGNAYGVVIDISNMKPVAIIQDGELVYK